MTNPNTNGIIVTATIGNQERQFLVYQEFPYSGLYHVFYNQEHVAEVLNQMGNWRVSPAIGRMLDGENCDALLQAVLNAEYPNS